MIQDKEKEINGNSYSVVQFPARQALKIKTRLFKLLGPSLTTLVNSLDKGLDSNLDENVLSKAVSLLVNKLDSDEVISLILELLSETYLNKTRINVSKFDQHYAGNFNELYQALFFVLEVNYGDFLGGMFTMKGES